MNAFVDSVLQSCIVQSPFFPPSVVILLIAGVFILCFKKPKPPPYVFEYDNSIPFVKSKPKKKQAVKADKKVKSQATVPAAPKNAQASTKSAPAASSAEVVRQSPNVVRRAAASSAVEEAGDWFQVTSSGKKKVVQPSKQARKPEVPPVVAESRNADSKKAEAKAQPKPAEVKKDQAIEAATKPKAAELKKDQANEAATKPKAAEVKKDQAKGVEKKETAEVKKDKAKDVEKKEAAEEKPQEAKEGGKQAQAPKEKKSKEAKKAKQSAREAKEASAAKEAEKPKQVAKKAEESPSKQAEQVKAPPQQTSVPAKKALEQSSLDDSGLGASFVEVKRSGAKAKDNKAKQQTVEVDGFVLAEYSPPSSASISPPISQQSDPVQMDSAAEAASAEQPDDQSSPSRTSGSAKKKQKKQKKKLAGDVGEALPSIEKAMPAVAEPPAAPAEAAWQEAPGARKKRRARRDN